MFILLLGFAMILSLEIGALPISVNETSNPLGWPATVHQSNLSGITRVAGELSNQERLARGLKPNQPKRLYKPNNVLLKRLTPQPSGITSSSGKYDFLTCSQNVSGGTTSQITNPNLFEAVTACANTAGANNILIRKTPGASNDNTYDCTYGKSDLQAESASCDKDNWAFYYFSKK